MWLWIVESAKHLFLFNIVFWNAYMLIHVISILIVKHDRKIYYIISRFSLGHDKSPHAVSVDDVTVSASIFERRYGRRIPIEIALYISSDGHFACVTQRASEKEGSSMVKCIPVLHIFSSLKSSMYWEIGENTVAEDPFQRVVFRHLVWPCLSVCQSVLISSIFIRQLRHLQ